VSGSNNPVTSTNREEPAVTSSHQPRTATGHPPGAASNDAVLALRDLLLAGMRFRLTVAEHFDIDLSASVALSHLSAHGPLSARELADLVGVTPSSMTALLDRLEAQDLATRARHPTDRRKTALTITERGQQSLTQVRAWMADALNSLDKHYAPPELARPLSAVARALNTQTAALRNRAGAAPHTPTPPAAKPSNHPQARHPSAAPRG
jgi:Transcriptional regulators